MLSRPSVRSCVRRSFTNLAVLTLSALALTACGGIQGKYSHAQNDSDAGGMKMTLELRGGSKVVMTLRAGQGQDDVISTEGTYKVEGDQVTLSFANDTEVFTRRGNTLVGKGFGETVEFVKE